MQQKQTVDLDQKEEHWVSNGQVIELAFDLLQQHCHAASYNRGWWHDPITGLSLIPEDSGPGDIAFDKTEVDPVITAWFPYVIATKIALIHSEASEMLEAHRRDKDDDKIPFAGITAEAGDVIIRICDLIGMLNDNPQGSPMGRPDDYDLGKAILAKLPVNASRTDHDLAKRAEPGQKKY